MTESAGKFGSRSGQFALPGFTLRDALRGGEMARESLHAAGVPLPPDNRLSRAERRLQWLARRADRDDGVYVDRAEFAGMLRTVVEFYFIARALLVGKRVGTEIADRLAIALGGNDASTTDTSTAARDAQFELAVAAVLHLAGIVGVKWAEPDLQIAAADRMIGVAVKRLSSKKKLERRVRDATKQVSRHAADGIIVLGLDAWADAADTDSADLEFGRVTGRARDLVLSLGASPPVFALLGIGTVSRWDGLPAGVITGLAVSARVELIIPTDGPEGLEAGRRLRVMGANTLAALQRELARLSS